MVNPSSEIVDIGEGCFGCFFLLSVVGIGFALVYETVVNLFLSGG